MANTIFKPELLDETTYFTLEECSTTTKSPKAFIIELISEDIIHPDQVGNDYHFTLLHIQRIRQAHSFSVDLGVNTPGIALALQLLEEIQELKGL